MEIKKILKQVKGGILTIDEAETKLKINGYEDIGFAKIDHSRQERTGQPEIIYCEGKSPVQILAIIKKMRVCGVNIFGTRANQTVADYIKKQLPEITYNPIARTLAIIQNKTELSTSHIAIVSAGTSDIPVAEEAYETAIFLGNKAEKIIDVGIAGIHRLFDKLKQINQASVIIVVAGMEGALASVIAGLTDKPVIAVPTSVGYGSGLGGFSALLTMLNSCTPLSVVNIDNGFGAACQASRINKLHKSENV